MADDADHALDIGGGLPHLPHVVPGRLRLLQGRQSPRFAGRCLAADRPQRFAQRARRGRTGVDALDGAGQLVLRVASIGDDLLRTCRKLRRRCCHLVGGGRYAAEHAANRCAEAAHQCVGLGLLPVDGCMVACLVLQQALDPAHVAGDGGLHGGQGAQQLRRLAPPLGADLDVEPAAGDGLRDADGGADLRHDRARQQRRDQQRHHAGSAQSDQAAAAGLQYQIAHLPPEAERIAGKELDRVVELDAQGIDLFAPLVAVRAELGGMGHERGCGVMAADRQRTVTRDLQIAGDVRERRRIRRYTCAEIVLRGPQIVHRHEGTVVQLHTERRQALVRATGVEAESARHYRERQGAEQDLQADRHGFVLDGLSHGHPERAWSKSCPHAAGGRPGFGANPRLRRGAYGGGSRTRRRSCLPW